MAKRNHLDHFLSNDEESVPKRFRQAKLHFGVNTIFVKEPRLLHKSTFSTSSDDSSIQTQLDLGQQKHCICICYTCGMAYNMSNCDDSRYHNSFHSRDKEFNLVNISI